MTGLTAAGIDRLRDAMGARVRERQMPGIVALLASGDDVNVDAIGTLAFDDERPMRRDTLFRITSMTKPIMAATTMMLIEDGLITLDEPVERLLPELADRRVLRRVDGPLDDTVPASRSITIEDLLTFRLGFGHVTEPTFNPPYPIVTVPGDLGIMLGPPDPRTPHTPDEWMARFGSLPLMEQPGERWRYNVGTMLLGVLVARAADTSLSTVLNDRLFTPLGMVDTGFTTTPNDAERMPPHYMSNGGDGEPVRQPHSMPDEWTREPAFPDGSAGLLSTVDDYHAFATMLRRGGTHNGQRLLTVESIAAMTTNHLTPDQLRSAGVLLDGQGWGYGMAVVTTATDAGLTPGQYGWSGGYGSTWFNDPDRDLTAIALTQTSDFLWNGGLAEFDALAVGAVAADGKAP